MAGLQDIEIARFSMNGRRQEVSDNFATHHALSDHAHFRLGSLATGAMRIDALARLFRPESGPSVAGQATSRATAPDVFQSIAKRPCA